MQRHGFQTSIKNHKRKDAMQLTYWNANRPTPVRHLTTFNETKTHFCNGQNSTPWAFLSNSTERNKIKPTLVLVSQIRHKRNIASSIRSPMVEGERMRSGKWLWQLHNSMRYCFDTPWSWVTGQTQPQLCYWPTYWPKLRYHLSINVLLQKNWSRKSRGPASPWFGLSRV